MAVGLMRGVALGPGGVGDDQRYPSNRRYIAETGCTWVRLWAEWPKLQPREGDPPDFAPLDSEIAAARADGLNVMLTAWRYPRWANGTAALTPAEDARYEIADRLKPGADPARRKDLTFRAPDDLDAGSPFGRWLAALGQRDVDAIEVVNEPNLQLWPQAGVHDVVARMIATARQVISPGGPAVVGPATSDRVGGGRLGTDHLEFTRALIDAIEARPDAWSHHTYGDVENDTGERLAAAGRLVRDRWPDMPIQVTETGARLTAIARAERLRDDGLVRRRQAELIARAYERLRASAAGDGVELVLQYLFITDMNYDSGLCELDGRPRPSYFAWAQLR